MLLTPLAILLAISGGTLLFVKHEVRHQQLNRRLIDAINAHNYELALSLLDLGAMGDAREKAGPPVTLKSLFEEWRRRKQPRVNKTADNPCALNIVYRYEPLFSDPPGMEKLAVALIAHGSPIEANGQLGVEEPLAVAVRKQQHRAVEAMLKAGASSNSAPCVADLLRNNSDIEDAELLLKYGADINRPDQFDFLALGDTDHQLVNLMLSHGANVNARNSSGDTPLMQACSNDRLETARVPLKAGADVNLTNKQGWNAALLACQHEDIELLNLLAKAGADFNLKSKNGNALNFAAQGYSSAQIPWLLKHGVDAKVLDEDNCPCLVRAAYFNSVAALTALMRAGSQFRCKDGLGNTLLHQAAGNPDKSVGSWALGLGLDVNATNAGEETAAHIAASSENLSMLKAIYARGGKLVLQDADGETPLILACGLGNPGTADWLLGKGSRPGVTDKEGLNALDILLQRLGDERSEPSADPDAGKWHAIAARLRQKGVKATKGASYWSGFPTN